MNEMMKYPHFNTSIGKYGKSDYADVLIRAALNAGKVMIFATSNPSSWKAHFTKRFPEAKIEEMKQGLRISK